MDFQILKNIGQGPIRPARKCAMTTAPPRHANDLIRAPALDNKRVHRTRLGHSKARRTGIYESSYPS